jgi:nucleoside-diphosphate-sugar epimerase
MRIFVTGVQGYIGSLLAPYLVARGHDVTGFDTGFYQDGWLYTDTRNRGAFPKLVWGDIRKITAENLAGYDAVVHLAELSNDPLAKRDPRITFRINHEGSVALAEKAKAAGVGRFVYTSSCSVYGVGNGQMLTETSSTNPQTAYAECKVLVERDVMKLAGPDFSPTFLRNATAYGASPRMRFDIVLNNLAGLAWTKKRIAMESDGSPWRPLVHVLDICKAVKCVLDAPAEVVHNEIFNVGDTNANYRVREIAEIVGATFPGCEVTIGSSAGDNRSYRVSFEKILTKLPGFSCDWDAEKGARQLREVFERIDMSPETFEFRAFTRLKQLEFLNRTRQVDAELFWTN